MKRKGFLLIEGILQIVVLGLVAVGFAALFSSQFTTLSASKTAVEARQMAELEAAYIRKIGYSDFNSASATGTDDNGFHKNGIHDKEIMTKFAGKTSEGGMGDKWYSKVSIVGVNSVGDGATVEKVNGDEGNNLKIARIEIYRAKDGTPNAEAEKTSRYSLEVPLSSQSGSKSGSIRLDYSRSIEIGIYNVQFVAPEDGMIFYSLPNPCEYFEARKAKIKINNVLILDVSMGSHGEQNGNAVIPISKGEIFSTETTTRTPYYVTKAYFVPYKK